MSCGLRAQEFTENIARLRFGVVRWRNLAIQECIVKLVIERIFVAKLFILPSCSAKKIARGDHARALATVTGAFITPTEVHYLL